MTYSDPRAVRIAVDAFTVSDLSEYTDTCPTCGKPWPSRYDAPVPSTTGGASGSIGGAKVPMAVCEAGHRFRVEGDGQRRVSGA